MPLYRKLHQQPSGEARDSCVAPRVSKVDPGGKEAWTVGRFADDPDFARRWPEAVIAYELRRLITIGERDGIDHDWTQEVELLNQQAFSSAVPVEDFRRATSQSWAYDDEPF